MADLKAEFEGAVAEAVQRLSEVSAPEKFTDDDGSSVRGWTIGHAGSTGPFRDGPWEERGSVHHVLDEKGRIWEVVRWSKELRETPWTIEHHVTMLPIQGNELVGAKGRPFAEWKARIERLGYY